MRVLVIACLLAGLVSAQEIPDAETGRSAPSLSYKRLKNSHK